jgi:histone acetyltransferase HTATIP/histone acetyltransferase MYST1
LLAAARDVDAGVRENGSEQPVQRILTEEELDATRHKQLTAQRNFDTVIFDEWKIRPWYVIVF